MITPSEDTLSGGKKVLHAPDDQDILARFARALSEQSLELPQRVMADPE